MTKTCGACGSNFEITKEETYSLYKMMRNFCSRSCYVSAAKTGSLYQQPKPKPARKKVPLTFQIISGRM